jgi:pyruvate formate lyase activating enzyme
MQCYIGDITHLSTSSWSGRISTVVHFAGCDFRCPGCKSAHINQFSEQFLRDEKDIRKEITQNRRFNSAVVFSGGEPCLQRDALFSLARFCRSKGLLVGVETNGSRPAVLEALLFAGLVDFIAFDMKSAFEADVFSKATRAETFFTKTEDIMASVRKSIGILKRHQQTNPKLEIEFRTTVIPGIVYKKEHFRQIAAEIAGIDCTYRLQQFRPEFAGKLATLKPPSQEFIDMLQDHIEKTCPGTRVVA